MLNRVAKKMGPGLHVLLQLRNSHYEYTSCKGSLEEEREATSKHKVDGNQKLFSERISASPHTPLQLFLDPRYIYVAASLLVGWVLPTEDWKYRF